MAPDVTSQKINQLFARERWADAQHLIEKELKRLPNDAPIRHWWLSRLSAAVYEHHDYALALGLARQAESIKPNCPLVLWDLANALDMLGEERQAIEVYTRLIGRGPQAIAGDECGEGIRKARGLLADCKYRLSLCYAEIGEERDALRFAREFMSDWLGGAKGIYTLEDIKRLLDRPPAPSPQPKTVAV
jgi:tetratricopeptide (TPR) repeat protein